ncbi:MAG: 50S ribosomal protein L11 [Candidatus Parcubacteria bacterium]|nr:MAG: 50S ribosomal protein L11 [Candidatus Parcubacteria bacterium]
MSRKNLKAEVKLIINAGEATPAPPIGPSLAPYGINIGEFCSKFNEMTKDFKGVQIPVIIRIFDDRSFNLILKKPPVSSLIKKYLKIEKGSGLAGKKIVGKLTKEDVKKIAEEKLPDLNTDDINQAIKIIEGTAKSMGIKIE